MSALLPGLAAPAAVPVRFFVHGPPQAKGSFRAVVSNRTGRAFAKPDNPRTKGWQQAVSQCAAAAMGGLPPLKEPCTVSVTFYMQRPLGHTGKKGLLRSAPALPAKKPDVDKLLRSTLDGLASVAFVDDSQVTSVHAYKRFAGPHQPHQGAWIAVVPDEAQL